jgi:hypothetical protein
MLDNGLYVRPEYSDLPNGSSNVFVVSNYITGELLVVYDNPAILPENGKFQLAGVNIYRAYDNPESVYTKLNPLPVTTLSYLDAATEDQVLDEDVSTNFTSFGTNALGEFSFKVNKIPIVKPGRSGVGRIPAGWGGAPTSDPTDVQVKINGVIARVKSVDGLGGEIILITSPVFDVATQKLIQPPVPHAGDQITATYTTTKNLVLTGLHQRVYYKVTAVAVDGSETPLNRVVAKTHWQTNALSYMWREAVRRNLWILQQGGERVLLFTRKRVGPKCTVSDSESEYTHHTHINDDPVCYGTGVVGGYSFAGEIFIAPPEAPKNLDKQERGIYFRWIYDTWTVNAPLIQQRDFIIRKDNTRMIVSAVNHIYDGGYILSQEMSVEALQENDIIYKVPVPDLTLGTGKAQLGSGFVTDKHEVEDPRQQKGRTRVFENIVT